MQKKITPAQVIWNEQNTPYSQQFGDIYFSNDDAIAETQYVFIDGNNLLTRFAQHNLASFTVGETGFGSGLNFLLLWQQFLLFRQQNPQHPLKKLRFVTVEKHPLLRNDVIDIHQYYTDLASLAQQLQAVWPNATYGKQSIELPAITLDFFCCDITEYADFLQQDNILVDAWFFDGFSPATNQVMWSAALFQQLYQHTQTKGSFATFTAAGYVKRNLAAAGFFVTKRKGFGIKREMLIGIKQ